eukprot:gene23638-8960_t
MLGAYSDLSGDGLYSDYDDDDGWLRRRSILQINSRKASITILRAGAFQDLLKLVTIDLILNGITLIEADAFSNLPQLSFIDLSDNSITIVRTGTFQDLPMLVQINLGANYITIVEDNAFSNLPQLTSLELGPWRGSLILHRVSSFGTFNLPQLKEVTIEFVTNADGDSGNGADGDSGNGADASDVFALAKSKGVVQL